MVRSDSGYWKELHDHAWTVCSPSGWWLILHGAEQGWVPGSYLKPANEEAAREERAESITTASEEETLPNGNIVAKCDDHLH